MDFFTINFVIFSVLVAAVLSLITNSRIKFNLLLIASLGYLTFWSWQAVLLVVGNSLLVAGLAKRIYKKIRRSSFEKIFSGQGAIKI